MTKYNNNYTKKSRILQQYYRDEPFSDDNDIIADFLAANNNIASFKFKQKMTAKTIAGSKNALYLMMQKQQH